eukprot:CAMPEP_0194108414 /NCGR_PEP_ID=MMETSP0150-20130528/8111_1 /TAXON_ID=122233 /ORGANISM="Chaetoceros debilis, Strain MM31A-1" /LENGTH=518 /DNA_ID=CAMNT_0038797107 /DNA_START=48 /DNA_END=1604 /DNA_ORIENTATION=-
MFMLRNILHLPRASARSTAAFTAFTTTATNTTRSLSTTAGNTPPPSSSSSPPPRTLLTKNQNVHSNMSLSKSWRNKPLFRRQGDVRFRTGLEASRLLVAEANRRDGHESQFISSVTSVMSTLNPIFERNPRYAFVAKQLMEPERMIQFRVPWLDDTGVIRMNRGYRIQYSSSLGPYEGALHFGSHVNSNTIKSLAFDAVFSNGLTGYTIGAAVGGSDINPFDKSEAEIQRFCQSFMTELVKYVGPDLDLPTMGMGVGEKEFGYLAGQHKRISIKSSSGGRPFLAASCPEAPGVGVVHFANEMMKDKGDSLQGKRCLIIGAGKVARSVAAKLLEFGAIPLTFSDSSGHVYEPNGIDQAKLKTIDKIKDERGALLGRYVIASTTAQFNDPQNILDVPCDLCFPCAAMNDITEEAATKLADNGCMAVVEGGYSTVTPEGRTILKKRGLAYGPHTLTMTGSVIKSVIKPNAGDDVFASEIARIYKDTKNTAQEFNARGDLYVGANISGFLRVANAMLAHGAV